MSCPAWAIGKNVTQVQLQGLVCIDGTLTTLTTTAHTLNLFGHVQEVRIEQSVEVENLSPMNRTIANNVPNEYNYQVVLTEIEKSVGTNLLASAKNAVYVTGTNTYAVDYWKMTIVRGAQTWIFHSVMTGYNTIAQKPSVIAEGTFMPADLVATANPSYA